MIPSLLGRDGELSGLEASLVSSRVLTLVGPPGIGKTSLARQLAAGHAAPFVALSEAHDLDGVVGLVGRALGLPLAQGRLGEATLGPLADAVVGKRVRCLVLDNAEQAVGAVAAFVRALVARPEAPVVVVTSRVPLHVDGETVRPVPPLAPADAVALLIRAARRLRPEYAPAGAARETLARVASALDHLPLALELSGARLALLDEEALLARIGDLDTLAGGRAAEARQRTLRDAIEWSFHLLDAPTRSVLLECAVFRGGFDVAAAEAVLTGPSVLDRLQTLVESSLLRSEATDVGPRLSPYEAVRAFCEERLDPDARATLVGRHLRHYLARGAALAAAAPRHGGLAALTALAVEVPNLEAAFAAASDPADALGVVLALEPVLATRGPCGRWISLLDRALSSPGPTDRRTSALRGRVLVARARARTAQGLLTECLADLGEALALARETGDVELEGRALGSRALYGNYQGTMEDVRRDLEAALALQRRAGDDEHACIALGNLANVLRDLGRMDEARATYDEALALARRIGLLRYEGFHLGNLGGLLHWQGRLSEARAHHEEALAILHQVSDLRFAAFFAGNLGVILQELGDLDAAEGRFDEALGLGRAVGDVRLVAGFVGYRASLAHERGLSEPARLEEARRRYQEALVGFAGAGDARHEILVTAALGALEATQDRLGEARALLDKAAAQAATLADPLRAAIVDVHRGHLDLAEARAAEATSEGSGVDARARARGRLVAIDEGALARSDDLRFARRLLAGALPADRVAPARTLVLGPDAEWFTFGAAPVDLRRRAVARRVLARLARGEASTEALLEVGWPGERMRLDAGKNRLRVAIAWLRSAGLDAVEASAGGYRLAAGVLVVHEHRAPV